FIQSIAQLSGPAFENRVGSTAGSYTGTGPKTNGVDQGLAVAAAFKTAPVPNFTVRGAPRGTGGGGGSGTGHTVRVTPGGGFTGTVNLGVSGYPTGSTVSFNPTTITTSGSTTLTITTPSGAAGGSYPLTITGTSGSLSNTASATLVVTN